MTISTFFCIDGHTCGNPVRVVTGGSIPQLAGATMFERRQHFLAEFDWIRTGLMFEDLARAGESITPARTHSRRRSRLTWRSAPGAVRRSCWTCPASTTSAASACAP